MSTFYRESGKYKPHELQHRFRKKVFFLLGFLLLVFALHLIVSSVFIGSFKNGSPAMLPSIEEGDYFLFSPFAYGPRIPFSLKKIFTVNTPQRGDLVLYMPEHLRSSGVVRQIADPLVRFFTLNRLSSVSAAVRERNPQLMIRRVIGIPGDTVKINGDGVFIKPREKDFFFSEYEQIPEVYDLFPYKERFSSEAVFPLDTGQYFILGDNRDHALDSEDFGPVSGKLIMGKVILRYFPFRKFGTL